MLVTRIGYILIIGVIATAIAAIAIVIRPDSASHPASLQFDQVINYSRFGVVERIETKGSTLTVRFRKEFDTKTQFGSDTHTFDSAVPAGSDLMTSLTQAGVVVNGDAGLQVVAR